MNRRAENEGLGQQQALTHGARSHPLIFQALAKCVGERERDADSLLAVNISNRFVDVRPLLRTLAAHYHLEAQLFYHPGSPPVPTPNLWMLLGRKRPAFFQLARPWQAKVPDKHVLRTDSNSDIFRRLRWITTPLDEKHGASR